jgi:formylglycine-generating enzyme required for sulfatase activity/dienelactone hydrolase
MRQFLQELRRRKVLRVAAAYIVATWVLLQVADLLSDILELPIWTPKLILVILVIGFVPSLILAWAYDLTPDGIEATPGGDGTPVKRGSSRPVVLAVGLVTLSLAIGGWWYSGNDVRWARGEAIPAIDAFLDNGDPESAFSLAMQVEGVIPKDPQMDDIWRRFSWTTSILSVPVGATVMWRKYDDPDEEWQALGVTPLYDIHVPFGPSVLRLEAPGYLPLDRVIGGGMAISRTLPVQDVPDAGFIAVNPERFVLETHASLPAGMVRVPEGTASIDDRSVTFRSFLLGRYEVTNKEFQKFVDAGGYRRQDLWEHEFVDNGETFTFDAAISKFVDSTGRPGPGTWAAGTFPAARDDYPVGGVSWYEAAAYARFVGRELPTIHHWRRAFAIALLAFELPASNVNGEAIAAVGEHLGIGWTGTYDMLGNVREWCLNSTADGQKVIVGGAWNDAPYLVEESTSTPFRIPAFDRSPTNGFRLAATNDEANVINVTHLAVIDEIPTPLPEPISDEVFAAKLSDFDYDQSPLDAEVEEIIEFRYWTRQRVTVNTSDGEDRIPIYLYLPKRETSRHQALVYWPGAATQVFESVDSTTVQLDFVLRNGRAVAMPILKGMYERKLSNRPGWDTHTGRDLAIEQVREFRRAIDYLETRSDIESDNLGFAGFSWGGRVGAIVLAVEDRFKVAVLNQAGINATDHTDINVVNFLPRVTTPVLHFSGRYDTDFRFETSSKPFYDRLGTPLQDKKHIVEPTGHFVAPAVVSGETLDWLDKYLGPVE